MRDALRGLELFVVSENVLSNDTVNAGAHVLLPAAAWGEKDGTVTNSERRISRQRAVPAAAGRGQAGLVDRRRGRRGAWASATAFAYRSAADVFREHAALSAFENDGSRDFDIGALARLGDERIRRARAGAMAVAHRGGGRRKPLLRATAAFSPPTARRA